MKVAGRTAWLLMGGTGIALTLMLAPPAATPAARSAPKRGPINATVSVDQARAASATITPAAGGAVAVTAAGGTKITVTLPAGAVTEDTTVTATPVTKLDSRFTRTGLLAGVQLQPEGLLLLKPATVRFTGRSKAPRGKRLVFVGTDGTGRDLHRLPPPARIRGKGRKRRYAPTGAAVVSITHFSTVEELFWSTATLRELDAINRPALGVHRLSQEISAILARGGSVLEVLEAMDRARERFIRPLLSQALRGTCSEAGIRRGVTAIRTALSFEAQVTILGGEGDDTGAALRALLAKTAACMSDLCPRLGDPRVGMYMLKLARQLQLSGVGSDAFFDALYANLEACSVFEVHLDSRIDHVFEEANYSLRVGGTAKVEPKLFGATARPRAPLTYVATSGNDVSVCFTTEISKTISGEFEVTEAVLGTYDPERPTSDPMVSVKLTVTTKPLESYHTRSTPTDPQCNLDPQADYDLPLWFTGFQSEHPDFTFPGRDFARDAAPKFAIAVYGPRKIDLGNGSVSENTLVEIVHTPRPTSPLPPVA